MRKASGLIFGLGLVFTLGSVLLPGCSNAPRGAKSSPAWFKESVRQSNRAPYPRLEEVPSASQLLRPADQWNALELELAAELAELAASPRAAPVPAGAQSAGEQFEAEARAALAERPTPP